MKNTIFTSFITLIILCLLVACASKKNIVYMQDLSDKELIKTDYATPKLKVDDRLTINISSLSPELARPYNLTLTSFNTGGLFASGQQQQQSYLVNKNGCINFPELGELKVIGMTRNELQKYLEEELKPLLRDAKANVQLVNFRITVLGEVNKPGEYIINRDKISILQALGLAGDLTIHGKRNNIKLLRENNGKTTTYNLDLRSKNILNSKVFYLEQNDVLYVEPNKPQVNASASSPTASYIISATGLLITIVSLLSN